MREIKFRAWDIEEGDWTFFTLEELVRGNALRHKKIEDWSESTGLKDKNGKEIYEGDILKIDQEGRKMFDVVGSDGSGVREYQVVSEKHGSWMTKRNQNEPLHFGHEDTYLWILLPSCEIAGNIYENKDLLL